MRTPLVPADSFAARMTDGAELILRRHGNLNKPRIVITHGNGFAVDGYRVFWEPLLADYEVVAFDMRNHGLSQPTGADGHNYQQMSRDIGSVRQAVAERWGEKKTVGVFHSMSGRAAMKHAVEIGWVWDALILFDPPNVPLRGHEQYEAMRGFELKLVEFAANRPDRFDGIDDMLALYLENRASQSWTPEAQKDMAQAVLRKETKGYVLSCQRELEASIYLAALTLDLWPPAAAYGGPTKLIGADPEMKMNVTGRANQALGTEQGYVYESVPGTGHLMQIEKPVECRAAMLSFLLEHGIV
jgi:pimeloyl-ACP methyl ester carboxylesterase